MEKGVFEKMVNDIFVSFGFRKQGVRRWIRKGNDISLKAYLQKSQYGDFYYLRDYYVLNKMQVIRCVTWKMTFQTKLERPQ